jgi:hypothetical protein
MRQFVRLPRGEEMSQFRPYADVLPKQPGAGTDISVQSKLLTSFRKN